MDRLSVYLPVLVALAGCVWLACGLVSERRRGRRLAALSWGVLAGLLHALWERDPRAGRHAAAVAAWSRDIAQALGMSARDCELAHTAGLLHDIGTFALGDELVVGNRPLAPADWERVRRHPELGARLVRDVDASGRVAEAVATHHERMDGRGYPCGLRGEAIPPLARIVAVAEVYDTLTSGEQPAGSFQAILELRRVSGTQLDAACVEALARVLAGRDAAFRHADTADLGRELALGRRVSEAGSV